MTGPSGSAVLLRWTGHPIIDCGVAGIVAFARRNGPEAVTADDLDEYAAWCETAFFTPLGTSVASVLFTMNSYLQPSKSRDERRLLVAATARAWAEAESAPGNNQRCTFCRHPAGRRVYRETFPMLTGRSAINFWPTGDSGLVLCGSCTTGTMGLMIGAPLIGGRVVVCDTTDPELRLDLARHWVRSGRERYELSAQTGEKPPPMSRPLTRLAEALVEIAHSARVPSAPDSNRVTPVTVLHLSNSGQGADIDIHELGAPAIRFLQRAQLHSYREAWEAVVERAWPPANKRNSSDDPEYRLSRRNGVYEDLFVLPVEARRFLRRHLRPAFHSLATQPRGRFGGATGRWSCVELFLEEVITMDAGRIEAIRALGDRMALTIDDGGDRSLLNSVLRARKYWEIRNALIRADRRAVMGGEAPLLRFDDFLLVFEESEELARADWNLAWDLVTIRVYEQLHVKQYFTKHPDVAQGMASQDTEESDSDVTGVA